MGITNKAGAEMKFGTGSGSKTLYCGRYLGKHLIPGSDGRCGPNNGPQCRDCKQVRHKNRVGEEMRYGTGTGSNTLYCGRYLGKHLIPGSDGRCGPNNGPQCRDCNDCNNWTPKTNFVPEIPANNHNNNSNGNNNSRSVEINNNNNNTINNNTCSENDEENCKICYEKKINCVLIPCGHLAFCYACANVLKSSTKSCGICRTPIASVVQTFHA